MEYERFEFTQPLYGGVNVLRVGDTLVDTGHVAASSREDLASALEDELAGIKRVLITHPHIDHVGGSQTIDALAELPHIVPEGSVNILSDYAGYLERAREEMTRLLGGFDADDDQWDVYFPLRDDYAEERINIDRTLGDGDTVEMGGYELEAVSTPGHADPHLAFHHEPSGTLLSGDLVDRDGRFQYGPLLGDVGDYKQSLRRVRELAPDTLVPMHGPAMEDPRARIDASLENAETTEHRLLEFLDRRDPCLAREFVGDELGVGGARAPFLTLVVYEYLRQLEAEGNVTVGVTAEGIEMREA